GTSTQEVLPAYWTVCGPGAGSDPRQPQTFTRVGTGLATPEDHHDADELVSTGEQRKCCRLDLAFDPVRALHQITKMRRAMFVERDPRGPTLEGKRFRRDRSRLERRDPVIERYLTRLRKAPADNRLRSLVVEDQIATRVRDERRRRQARRELTRKDQDEMLVPLRVHFELAPATLQANDLTCERSPTRRRARAALGVHEMP